MNGYVHGAEFAGKGVLQKHLPDVIAAANIGVLAWRSVLCLKKLRKGGVAE